MTVVAPTETEHAALRVWMRATAAESRGLIQERVGAWAASPRQRELLTSAAQLGDGPASSRFYPPVHLPLLVHHAVAGDAPGAPVVAAATALVWAGARLLDDLHDGDLRPPWSELPASELVFTAFAVGTVLPPALLAELPVAPERLAAAQQHLARALLATFAGQQRDLDLTDAAQPSVAEVEASVAGKNGGPVELFCALPALVAGADAATAQAWARFGRAFGVVRQLTSDAHELHKDTWARDLAQGTRTLQIAVALERCEPEERHGILELLDRARTDAEAQAAVRATLRQPRFVLPWHDVVARHVNDARAALAEAAPSQPARAFLEALLRERTPGCV